MKLKFNNIFVYITAAILLLSAIMRFSWDIAPRTFLHLTVVVLVLSIIKENKLYFNLKLMLPAVFFAITCILSLAFNSNIAVIRDNIYVVIDALVLMYTASITVENDKDVLLIVPVLTGFFLSIVVLTLYSINIIGIGSNNTGVLGPIINYNLAADFLLLILPLSFIFWENNGIPGISVSLIVIFAILSLGSRAASIISVFVFMFYAYFVNYKHKKLIFLANLALFLALAMMLSGKTAIHDSLANRIIWFHTAFAMFIDKPLNGIGWGNFGDYYLYYRVSPGLNSIYAHNILLQILAETGLLGFGAFLFIVYSFLNAITHKSGNITRKYRFIIALAVIGFLLLNMSDYGFYIPSIMCFMFFIIGLGFDPGSNIHINNFIIRWVSYCLLVIYAGYITLPFLSNVMYTRSNYCLNKGDINMAIIYGQKSIMLDKLNWQNYSKLSEVYFTKYTKYKSAVDLTTSINMQINAIKYFPQCAKLYSDLAWLYAESNDYKSALNFAQKAAFYDKFNPRYKETAGIFNKKLTNESVN